MFPIDFLLVGIGGAVGAACRYWLTGLVDARGSGTFPWGTLAVNTSGALLLGILAGGLQVSQPEAEAGAAWILLAVGVLGSYTTVSSFSLQTFTLLRSGETARAVANTGLSFGLCIAAAALGWVGGMVFLGHGG